jgi:hypothetical protein
MRLTDAGVLRSVLRDRRTDGHATGSSLRD